MDESGDLNFPEFRDGLRKLPFEPYLSLSAEDWDVFANVDGSGYGELTQAMFLEVICKLLE